MDLSFSEPSAALFWDMGLEPIQFHFSFSLESAIIKSFGFEFGSSKKKCVSIT